MTHAVTFDNVRKVYPGGWLSGGKIEAVKGVSLTIPTGSVFGLLGPNRAGKTTLIRLLLSLCRLDGGSVARLGRPVGDRSTLARVGYMHENQHFPRYLTATEILYFYGSLTMVSQDDLRVRVPKLLARVGLADRDREPLSRFSKGMVQRLGLAQALINEPDLLILDEPSEGLDLTGRQLLREVVAEQKRAGKTVVLVSHVLTEVEHLCDSVAVIVRGSIAATGRIDEMRRDPKTGEMRSLESVLQPIYTAG